MSREMWIGISIIFFGMFLIFISQLIPKSAEHSLKIESCFVGSVVQMSPDSINWITIKDTSQLENLDFNNLYFEMVTNDLDSNVNYLRTGHNTICRFNYDESTLTIIPNTMIKYNPEDGLDVIYGGIVKKKL